MPVNGNKVTMLFQNGSFAISESHIYLGNAELSETKPDAKILFNARYALMGATVQAIGVRISREGVFRDSLIFGPEDLALPPIRVSKNKLDTGDSSDNNPDQARACALLRMEASVTQRKSLYLAGIPDDTIMGSPPVLSFGSVPGFLQKFQNWSAIMVGGKWGFVVVNQATAVATRLPIMAFAQQGLTGLLGIVVTGVVPFTAPYNRFVIRGCRMSNRAYQSPNGRWQVAGSETGPGPGQTTYWLRDSKNIPAAQVTTTGTVESLDFQAIRYTNIIPRVPATRKRGNRSLVGPGRRSTRKLLVG